MAETPNDGNSTVDDESEKERVLLQKQLDDEKVAREAAEKIAVDSAKALEATVTELKELRKKKGPESTIQPPQDGTTEVETAVQNALAQERAKQADANKQIAVDRFKQEQKVFHADNDPQGLKFSAVKREFEGFNTDGLYTVDEFLVVLNKARRLVVSDKDTAEAETIQPDGSTNREQPNPQSTPPTKLSAKELELIKTEGWTEERYLKLKVAQPAFIKNLLDRS